MQHQNQWEWHQIAARYVFINDPSFQQVGAEMALAQINPSDSIKFVFAAGNLPNRR